MITTQSYPCTIPCFKAARKPGAVRAFFLHDKCFVDVINHPLENELTKFYERTRTHNDEFVVVLIIPTGIGCELGGHAGDAGPVAKLLGGVCDTLILHPNVVNASDINEMPANALYVEGSTITRLLMGQRGLQRVRSNKILAFIQDDLPFTDQTINAVNAARSSYGLDCDYRLFTGMTMESVINDYVGGEIKGEENIHNFVGYDAVSVSSVVTLSEETRNAYYAGELELNPWGGVEAMLTHTLSMEHDLPFAHAPMLASMEEATEDFGIVDPRQAAEVISLTFLQSVLKGLHRSPKICHPSVADITVSDIDCLIIPDGCVGLPLLAALRQGIQVIAVGNKNIMDNVLPTEVIHACNYFEAAGMLTAIREGVTLESCRREVLQTVT